MKLDHVNVMRSTKANMLDDHRPPALRSKKSPRRCGRHLIAGPFGGKPVSRVDP